MRKLVKYALITAIGLSATAGFAAGGGGGGGGSSPSQSSPKYDPAEEYQKGVDALKAEDFKAAKKAFDRVTSAAPKSATAHFLAGMARTGLSDHKSASKSYKKAVRYDPEMYRAHQSLGEAYVKLGDLKKAGKVMTALKTHQAKCAESCAKAADIKAAIDGLEAAISGASVASLPPATKLFFASAETGDGQYLAAVSLINEGRYEQALDSLDRAATVFGPHPDILTYQGFANRKLKRYDIAESYYRQALTVAPDHLGATEYFGELMVERGQFSGAKAMLARLDAICTYGCAEAEELRAWIDAGQSPHSAS